MLPHADEQADLPAPNKSIFDEHYPVPVAMTLTAIIYVVSLMLPFRFKWTVYDLAAAVQGHHHQSIQATPSTIALALLSIPSLFFFVIEFAVIRSPLPVSPVIKVLFIAGVVVSSLAVALISPYPSQF